MANVKKINGYDVKDETARNDISSLKDRASSLETRATTTENNINNLYFDTITDLKSCTTLNNNDVVKTLGYYSINDNGGALYKVRNKTLSDVIDDMVIIELDNDEIIAELILEKETITPEQFGAKGDNETNDTTSISACISYAYENKCNIKFINNKTYLVSNITIPSPISIDFNNAVIKSIGDDAETSVLNIGLASDTFETKTSYADKFNISNIYVDVNETNRKYGVEIHVRRQRFNRIYVRKASNTGIYVGDNDGVWIDSIFVSGDNTNTTSGVDIDTNDIILGNVEVAYCRHGVRVLTNQDDIIIDNLHAWCDIDNSSCIKFLGGSYYADIHSLVMDSTKYGIDIASVSGLGKMHVGTVKVFPSATYTSWQLVRINTAPGTRGITVDNIYGLTDSDTTNHFTDFRGIIMSGLNYTQRPKLALQFATSGSNANFEQVNGKYYQTDSSQFTGNGSDTINLGSIGNYSTMWESMMIPVVIQNSNYAPVGFGTLSYNSTNGWRIRTTITLTDGTTYRFRILEGLPAGYSYKES